MIETQDLKVLTKLIPASKIAKHLGLSAQNFFSKLKNNSELSTVDSKKITELLKSFGLGYSREMYNDFMIEKEFPKEKE